jgi:hypothetical protein
MADWDQYMRGIPQGYRTASSGSVYNPSQEILVLKTRRQPSSGRTAHEARVPRLGDMNISQKVAGTAMGSGQTSANPSKLDLAYPYKFGVPLMSQENVLASANSEASIIVGVEAHKEAMLHKRDVSSFYSHQSENPSGEVSPSAQSLRPRPVNIRDNMPIIHQDLVDKASGFGNKQFMRNEPLRGRFVEQFGDSSVTLVQDQDVSGEMVGQRKVSPGWMTGGRRMGYGYTMVANAEGGGPHVDGAGIALPNGGWRQRTPEPTPGSIQTQEMTVSFQHGADMAKSTHLGSPEQAPSNISSDSRCYSTRQSSDKALDEPLLTTDLWARIKSHSVRGHDHAPLAVHLAEDQMAAESSRGSVPVREQLKVPAPSKGVDYIEDAETFLGRWKKNSRNEMQLRPKPFKVNKANAFKSEERQSFQEGPPPVQRRFSMDQTNRPQSVYFDSRNVESADQLEETPTSSRSGRWILRFSRNREGKRRSEFHPGEPSQESSVQHQDSGHRELGRINSTRSDMAEELASAYQECIEMPGAFYGSKWASRTSLVVEAE